MGTAEKELRKIGLKREVDPYPSDWARGFDFVPSLRLQAKKLDPDLELYYCIGVVSFREGEQVPSDFKKGKAGSDIKVEHVRRNQYTCKFGDPGCMFADAPLMSQKELFRDITGETAIEEVILKARGAMIETPNISDPRLEGSEYIFHQQSARGNHTKMFKRVFPNVPIRNFCKMTKQDLVAEECIKPQDPYVNRIRSLMATDWLVTETSGYHDLPILDLLRVLARPNHWWQDIGKPALMKSQVEVLKKERGFEGQLYWLEKKEHYIAASPFAAGQN